MPATVALLAPGSRNLVLRMNPLPAQVLALPNSKILPCRPNVAVEEGHLELSCSFASIPPAFLRVSGSVTGS